PPWIALGTPVRNCGAIPTRRFEVVCHARRRAVVRAGPPAFLCCQGEAIRARRGATLGVQGLGAKHPAGLARGRRCGFAFHCRPPAVAFEAAGIPRPAPPFRRGGPRMTSSAHQAAQLDTVALARYLENGLPGFKGPVTAEKTLTGQSNPTFVLTSPTGRYVLRKKPPGQLLKSAHAVDREYRVMKALQDTDVPVPRMLILCEDDSVLGTAFFVMAFVHGIVFWDPSLPELDKAQRAEVYDQQNKALAALHLVEPARVQLADFGKAGSYFARQRDRWTKQYRA